VLGGFSSLGFLQGGCGDGLLSLVPDTLLGLLRLREHGVLSLLVGMWLPGLGVEHGSGF